ncbi:MAG: hypothetical protein JWO82_4420 [Akkermansiaceae bacterium]|nr:hypothetical protein [Akkermansiaceae bacterium]
MTSSSTRHLLFGLAGVAIVASSSCKTKPNWQAFELNGLKMEVPVTPAPSKAAVPESVASVMEEFKMWTGHWSDGEMNLAYSRYRQPANLRGAFDGAVSGLKTVLTDLEVKDTPVDINGRSAIEGRATFVINGKKGTGYLLSIVDGNQLWQIQLIGPGGTLGGAEDKIKASLKFN